MYLADTQKPTLQKSLPCSYASGTHHDEGYTYNMRFSALSQESKKLFRFSK